MKPAKFDWVEIKKAYKVGKTVDEIVDTYGVTKKTLQNRISAEKWEVSGRIKSSLSDFEKSIGKITDEISLNPDLSHIITKDVVDLINGISHLIDSKKIIYSATQLNLVRTTQYLQNNKKLEKINVGDGIQKFEEVGLGADDFKYCQDTIDKASVTLKVNDRFAPKQDINLTNNQIVTVEIE